MGRYTDPVSSLVKICTLWLLPSNIRLIYELCTIVKRYFLLQMITKEMLGACINKDVLYGVRKES